MANDIGFRDRVRLFGLNAALHHAIWRRLHNVTGYTAYQGLQLPAETPFKEPPPVPELVCREMDATELARYAADPIYDFDQSFLPIATARGDRCMGVFAGDKLVSYSFNTRHPTEFHPKLRYHFPDGWIYHFKTITLPQWRGQRVHARNLAAVLRKYRSEPGFKGIVTLVIGANHPSLRSFERMGFQPSHRFVVLRRESDSPWILGTPRDGRFRIEKMNRQGTQRP